MSHHAAAKWPGSPLIDPVLRGQEQVEQFVEFLLRISNPVHDLVARSFGMFGQYSFPEVHKKKVLQTITSVLLGILLRLRGYLYHRVHKSQQRFHGDCYLLRALLCLYGYITTEFTKAQCFNSGKQIPLDTVSYLLFNCGGHQISEAETKTG